MRARPTAFALRLTVIIAVAAAAAASAVGGGDQERLDWALLSGRMLSPKCVDIPENMSICHNIGYNRMRLPNLLEHDNLADATLQAASWKPLVGVQCHPDTRIFLCSLFAPVCLDRVIYPCRSFCQSVRNSCEKRMNAYGFSWPDMFACDKYPSDAELCLPAQTNVTSEKGEDEPLVCPACKEPDTYEGILHNHCTSEFTMKVNVTSHSKRGRQVTLSIDKDKRKIFFKDDAAEKKKGDAAAGAAAAEPRKRKEASRSAEIKQLNTATRMYVNGSASCECDGRIQDNGLHMIAGYRDKASGKIYVNFITPWMTGRQTKRSVRLALKAFQAPGVCSGGLYTLNVHKKTEEEVEKEEKRNKLRNR